MPSTNSEAVPSGSLQLPMSPLAAGSPVVRERTKPAIVASGSASAAAQARRSPSRTSAAAVAEAHGGSVAARSDDGGATFEITLPLLGP